VRGPVLLAAVALACAASAPIGAQAQQGRRPVVIIGSNTNAPGVLGPQARFEAADTDKDGKVTKAELAASLNPDARKYVNYVWTNRDKNRDGWLSQDELTTNGMVPLPGPSGTTGPSGGDGPSPLVPVR